MAYTPPLGTAVDFQFSGLAYTPPVGTAVDFTFSPAGGTAAFDLLCDVAALGAHGTAADCAISIGVGVAADALHGVGGDSQFYVPLLVDGIGGTSVSGDMIVDIAFGFTTFGITGDGVFYGGAVASLSFTVTAIGDIPPAGACAVDLSLQVDISGQLVPVGSGAVLLRPSVAAVSSFVDPYYGTVSTSLFVDVAAAGKVGRVGTAAIDAIFNASGAGSVAVSGVVSTVLQPVVQSSGVTGVLGTASASVDVYVEARSPVPQFDTTYVKLRASECVVLQ